MALLSHTFSPRPCGLVGWGTRGFLDTATHLAVVLVYRGFPGGARGKEPACQCRRHKRDLGLIPRLGISSGGGHGNSLQYSCLEKPMDRGA